MINILDIDDKTLVFYNGEVYTNTTNSFNTIYTRRQYGRK